MENKLKRTERGWGGHFICADRCLFRRNTLLEYGKIKIVVSTVGLMRNRLEDGFEEIGYKRYYETMAFHSKKNDKRYSDADVSKEICFRNDWAISELDADDNANNMHEKVVEEISKGLLRGEKFVIEH